MGNLPTEEIFHLLVRRLARALSLSHASVILANAGDRTGVVATAFEQPQLHDLEIELDKYPEVVSAFNGQIPVLIPDLKYCPLYAPLREKWAREGTEVTIRSVMALPFPLDEAKTGVFLLRRTDETAKFDAADVQFAETVVKSGVAAIQRAHALETTRADNTRLEALAQTDPLTQLVNRRALTVTLVTEMERVRRYNAPLAMLLVDLDHFKLINDTYGHLAGDEVEVLPWMTDHLVLVVPSNHNLTRKKSIKLADLRKERFILREAGSATRAAVAHHLKKADLEVETVMEMENPESVKKAVQSGLGIAFISKFAVETELKARSLVALNVNGIDINRELKIVYRKDKHLGRAAQTFISMAQITRSKDRTR